MNIYMVATLQSDHYQVVTTWMDGRRLSVDR